MLAILVLAAACSGDPARRYGRCDDGEVHVGSTDYLAVAERWIHVKELTGRPHDAEGTVEVGVVGEEVMGGARRAMRGSVAMHDSYLPGIEWALGSEGAVYLALAEEGFERELVAYVLVDPAGDELPFFPGFCQYDALTAPLRAEFGHGYAERMRAIIGLTGEDLDRALARPAA